MFIDYPGMYKEIYILPLSHKSGKLCLCDPFNVSDLICVFLLNSWVFFKQKPLFFFQLVLEPCGRMAEKKSVGPKLAVFRPFPRGKCRGKKKSISRPRHHWDSMPSRPKPCLKPPYRILPPSPTFPPSAASSPRYVPH